MFNRRTFLKTTAAGAVAISARPAWALDQSHPYMKTMGLQLYTVRDQMTADPIGTMKAIAGAGYHQVETSTDNLARDVAIAKDNGMAVTSAFMDWRTLGEADNKDAMTMEATLDAATEAGLKHLVFGYIGADRRKTREQYEEIIELTNAFGSKCKGAGIQLCYHNHAFEFETLAASGEETKSDTAECGFEMLMRELDEELVKFEFDVFWAALGGWDPIKTMRRLDGRISQLHLKDLKAETPTIYDESQVPKSAFQELGNGTIDMAEVIAVGQEIGIEQCHVEQDQSPHPIKSIGMSMEHLRELKA